MCACVFRARVYVQAQGGEGARQFACACRMCPYCDTGGRNACKGPDACDGAVPDLASETAERLTELAQTQYLCACVRVRVCVCVRR